MTSRPNRLAGHGVRTPAEAERLQLLFGQLFPASRCQHILDVGTGTGFVALMLAELGHEVTGIDTSAELLEVARTNAGATPHRVSFILGDITSPQLAELPGLAVPAGGFDAVVGRHVLWALPDPVPTIRTWAALTRPGGQVVAIGAIRGGGPIDRLTELAGARLRAARTRARPRPSGAPLRDLRDPAPAGDAFAHAGLGAVRTELLPEIDKAERAGMSPTERLRPRWRRYLVAGTVPGSGASTNGSAPVSGM